MDNEKYQDRDDIDEDDSYNNGDDENYVELYSKKSIFWFTLFFTTLFGGTMLNMNLRNAGYRAAAISVLLFSVAFYLLTAVGAAPVLLYLKSLNGEVNPMYFAALYSFVCNAIGGLILTRYYYKRYLPDEDYYPRSINAPMGIALAIFILQAFAMRYTGIQL